MEFWQNLMDHNLVSSNTIIGGDLNFSLGLEESWGDHTQIDPISDQMSTMLETFKFFDVPMNKKLPTWHNKRMGEAALGRRLDRFMIHENLLCTLPLYTQCVGIGGSSDHLPIYLQIFGPSKKPRAPFKFFIGHLKDPDFINLVTEFWRAQPPLREQRMATDFYVQLKKLKTMIEAWSRQKKMRDEQNLKDVELQITQLIDEKGLGYLTDDTKLQLISLEK